MRSDYAAHNLGGGAVVGGARCTAQLALQPKLGILPQRRIGVGGADPGDLAIAGKNLRDFAFFRGGEIGFHLVSERGSVERVSRWMLGVAIFAARPDQGIGPANLDVDLMTASGWRWQGT